MKAIKGQCPTNSEGQSKSSLEPQNRESWTAHEWESYLQALEVGMKESQLGSQEIERHALAPSVFSLASSASPLLASQVEQLLSQLSEKQRHVILAIFWQGASERKIAASLGVSRTAVQRIKARAIKKLRTVGLDTVSTLPLMKAHAEPSIKGKGDGDG